LHSLLARIDESATDPRLLVPALVCAGRLAVFVDIASAMRLIEHALPIARALGDERCLVDALNAVCAAHVFAGEEAAAIEPGEEAVARARELGDDALLGQAMAMLLLAMRGTDPAQTEQLLTEAIARSTRAGDDYLVAMLHNNAGILSVSAGDYAGAADHLRLAEQHWEAAGARMYNAKITLAVMDLQRGDSASANANLGAALRLARRTGDAYGLGYVSGVFALVAEKNADWREAARLHGVAQGFIERIGLAWAPGYRALRDASIDAVRDELGVAEYERLCNEARTLTVDAALQILAAAARRDAPPGLPATL
jgi:tetratricopeptide (TPR) repeat protein